MLAGPEGAVELARPHIAGGLAMSANPAARNLRRAALGLLALLGAESLVSLHEAFAPATMEIRDLAQDYILGKSFLAGVNPYSPVPPEFNSPAHVVAHPPTASLFFFPISFLQYETFSIVWMALELWGLVAGVYLLGRGAGCRLGAGLTALLSLALVAWPPVYTDLYWGQTALIQLPLVAGAWWALRERSDLLAGVLVGLTLIVKPFAWPLLLLLLFRRQWSAVAGCAAAVAAAVAVTLVQFGAESYVTYLTDTLPRVNSQWRGSLANISLNSLPWRVFDGTTSVAGGSQVTPPLLANPALAQILSLLIPAFVLIAALVPAVRLPRPGLGFGLVLGASVLASPISWSHYIVLMLVGIAQVLELLASRRFPPGLTNAALVTAALLTISDQAWLVLSLAATGYVPEGTAAIPFPVSMSTWMPTTGVIALTTLLWVALSPSRAAVPSEHK